MTNSNTWQVESTLLIRTDKGGRTWWIGIYPRFSLRTTNLAHNIAPRTSGRRHMVVEGEDERVSEVGRPPTPVEVGGRLVDDAGVNSGVLRCPRCLSRVATRAGTLETRDGDAAVFWLPARPAHPPQSQPPEPGAAVGLDLRRRDEQQFDWRPTSHEWWWRFESFNSFDNAGLSRVVHSPRGAIQLVLCSECEYPFGYQLAQTEASGRASMVGPGSDPADSRVWVCAERMHQQDPALANDAEDFRAPPAIDVESLRRMIAAGQLAQQFDVVFTGARIGMMLTDAKHDPPGVEVMAFTEQNGELGPAELSGKIKPGDRVIRVGGRSTAGLDYAAVLDAIIEAPRPVTIRFERPPSGASAAFAPTQRRVEHTEWRVDRDASG